MDAERAEEVANVVPHRLRAQVQLLRDLLGRRSALQEAQHLDLPRRQVRGRRLHFFLFDGADANGNRKLFDRGQLDASRPGNGLPVTGADLRAAVDAVLAGRPVDADQRPSLGCNIKWKPGNEPDYA